MQLVIQTDGSIRCLYDESLDLHALGRLAIARGSHVEPNVDGTWSAALSPVGGPILGSFGQRSDALAAERGWLESNWLCASPDSPHSQKPDHPFQNSRIQRELLRHGTREQLIAWLAWNDGNGIWTDDDSRANEIPPLTLETARAAMRKALRDS